MRKIAFIFLFFSYCGIKNIHAESAAVFSVDQISSLNKFLSAHTEKRSAIYSGHSDDHPYSKKGKKRKRAILPPVTCHPVEYSFIINGFKIALFYSPETLYLFCPYFGDDERGPPIAVTVS